MKNNKATYSGFNFKYNIIILNLEIYLIFKCLNFSLVADNSK